MLSWRAICLFASPRTARRTTSRSRAVSWDAVPLVTEGRRAARGRDVDDVHRVVARRSDEPNELVGRNGLEQVARDTGCERGADIVLVVVGAEDENRRRSLEGQDPAGDVNPVPVGQPDVDQDDVRAQLTHEPDGTCRRPPPHRSRRSRQPAPGSAVFRLVAARGRRRRSRSSVTPARRCSGRKGQGDRSARLALPPAPDHAWELTAIPGPTRPRAGRLPPSTAKGAAAAEPVNAVLVPSWGHPNPLAARHPSGHDAERVGPSADHDGGDDGIRPRPTEPAAGDEQGASTGRSRVMSRRVELPKDGEDDKADNRSRQRADEPPPVGLPDGGRGEQGEAQPGPYRRPRPGGHGGRSTR